MGAAYHWVDRLPWTEDDIRRYLSDPAVSLWILTVGDVVGRLFRAAPRGRGSTEIVYFGLFPEFTGRGLGGFLLTEAVERAWARRRAPRLAPHLQFRSPLRDPELSRSRVHGVQDRAVRRCPP